MDTEPDIPVDISLTKPPVDRGDTPELKGFFNIQGKATNAESNALRDIYEYLSSQEDIDDMPSMLYSLRELESRLPPTKLGETRLGNIQTYIHAERAVEQAKKERDILLR